MLRARLPHAAHRLVHAGVDTLGSNLPTTPFGHLMGMGWRLNYGMARPTQSPLERSAHLGFVRRAADDGTPEPHASDNPYLALAERLAYWMDRRYIDPILGVVLPGAGDVLGSLIGLLGIFAAFKLRAHPIVIARMLLNLTVDSVLGAIPVAGMVVDFFYRANSRNLELLRERDVRTPRASDYLLVGGAALLFVAALVLPIVLVIWGATWLASHALQ